MAVIVANTLFFTKIMKAYRYSFAIKQKTIIMKNLVLASLIVFFTMLSCGLPIHDPKNTEDRDYALGNFTGISASSAIEVEVVPAAQFRVTAIGHFRDLDHLSVKVRNNVLEAKCTRFRWVSGRSVKLLVEMPKLNKLTLSGAAEAKVMPFDSAMAINIDLTGAAELRLNTRSSQLSGQLSGASELRMTQPSQSIQLDLSGASELDAFDAPSVSCDLELSGASEASVQVSDLLKVYASGASTVRYKGNPRVEKRTSGSSEVRKY
jgi:hypothetical protein